MDLRFPKQFISVHKIATTMSNFIEWTFVNTFNRLAQTGRDKLTGGLPLGMIVRDERITKTPFYLPTTLRTQHMAILGKTGTGKTSFIRSLIQHDIDSGRGLAAFDLHGDIIPAVLRYLAEKHPEFAERVVVIDPTNPAWAVGMNPLEVKDEYARFREVAGATRGLADKWNFHGARTEELLRNSLFVLSANGLTLLEVAILLVNEEYRKNLLKRVSNQEVREYFELRFDPLSESMKATMREPVLNKLTDFTADPHFRYLIGQRRSTVGFDDAMARGLILLFYLPKGQCGDHTLTLGSLFLTKLTAAMFRRQRHNLFTIYADEMQNLASADTDFETLFSEARKFGVGIVTANQFQAQLPQTLRSAIQAIGTRVFFQCSPEDSAQVAQEIDGGRAVAERLRNLPQRYAIVRSSSFRPCEIVTRTITNSTTSTTIILETSNRIYARRKSEIDADILARRPKREMS